MTLQRILVHVFGCDPPGADKLRLENAALCVDCETLSPARGEACIACGGRALLNLKRVLGGIRPEESARLVEPAEWWSCFTSTFEPDRRCQEMGTPQAHGELLGPDNGIGAPEARETI